MFTVITKHPHHLSTAPLPPEDFPNEPDQTALLEQKLLPELGAPDAGAPALVKHDGAIQIRSENSRTVSTSQMAVPDVGARVANTNVARITMLIRNTGATVVYLAGEQQSCTPTQGWPLNPTDAPLLLQVIHEVWVCSSGPGVTGAVATLQQNRDGG